MKKKVKLIPLKFFTFVGVLILGMSSFSAFAQQEILLYSTDFTNWPAADFSGGSNSDVVTFPGSNFQADYKPVVYPSSSVGGKTGYIEYSSNGGRLIFIPFDFVSGGSVVVEVCHESTSSGRKLDLTADASASGITAAFTVIPPMGSTPVSVSGNSADFGKQAANNGIYEVTYTLASTITGTKYLVLKQTSTDLRYTSLKVYSGVGAVPYVAATNYPKAPAAGLSIAGSVGGPEVPGTVNVKGWNISGDVTLSIEGTDAAKFSLPVTTLTNAQALVGQDLTVNFTPSVKEGIANAQLKISSTGAPDYYVSLTGVTGGGTPKITTSSSEITIWTSLIAEKSTYVNVVGVSLTGPVSLSLEGPGASRFSLDATSVSLADASVGKDVKLTFVGDIKTGEHDAELVLTSPGTTEVRIPLTGVTLQQRPVLYSLTFEVSPGGSAYVEPDIAGPYYLEGTEVTVIVTPETNKKVSYWSDAAGNNRVERTFTVGEFKNGVITVFMEDGVQQGGGGEEPVGELKGLIPANIQETQFSITWTPVVDAVDYTVKVYDEDGNIIQTIPGLTGTGTDITGLSPGTLYKYSVETTVLTETHNTGELGPFRTLGSTYSCGQ